MTQGLETVCITDGRVFRSWFLVRVILDHHVAHADTPDTYRLATSGGHKYSVRCSRYRRLDGTLLLVLLCSELHPSLMVIYVQVVQKVVAEGGCVNERSRDGFVPLCIAAFWGHADIVEFLLENGFGSCD